MKKLFTLLMVVAAISVYAQPTITSYVAGSIGDEMGYTNVNTTDFDPGAAGADVTWDFSGISTSGTLNTYTLIDPAATGEAALFPGANTASEDGAGNYGFYKITSSEYSIYGVDNGVTTISYSDPETVWVFPMNFGTTNSDELYAEYFSGVDLIREGNTEFHADGYGTLILPSGTFTNVLRVKVEEDYSDVAVDFPFSYEYNFDLYYWFKEGIKGPVFQYFNLEYLTAGIPTTTESYGINYDLEVGIEDHNADIQLNIFPNPATEAITLTAAAEVSFEHVELVNINGQVVLSEDISGTKAVLDVHEQLPGLYVVRISSSKGNTLQKITIL